MYRSGITEADLQKERDEILAMEAADVRKLAEVVRAVLDCKVICVVGSSTAIEDNKELFGTIENLS